MYTKEDTVRGIELKDYKHRPAEDLVSAMERALGQPLDDKMQQVFLNCAQALLSAYHQGVRDAQEQSRTKNC